MSYYEVAGMTLLGFRLSGLVISFFVTLRGTVSIVILYLKSKELQSAVILERIYTETLRCSGIQIVIVCKQAGGVRTIVLLLAVCFLGLPTYFFTTRIEVVYTQAIPTGCHISITVSYDQYMLAVLLSLCAFNNFRLPDYIAILIHFIFFGRTLSREQLVSQFEVLITCRISDNDSLILVTAKHILAISSHILAAPIYSGFFIMHIEFCPYIAFFVFIRSSCNSGCKCSECSGITRDGNQVTITLLSYCIHR